jgi:hypothetical protein
VEEHRLLVESIARHIVYGESLCSNMWGLTDIMVKEHRLLVESIARHIVYGESLCSNMWGSLYGGVIFLWNDNHELGTGVVVHKRIISAVKRVEFVSDRMSYIMLRGRWGHIIVLNVHAPTEDKTDDVKDSVYEELECTFDKSPNTI